MFTILARRPFTEGLVKGLICPLLSRAVVSSTAMDKDKINDPTSLREKSKMKSSAAANKEKINNPNSRKTRTSTIAAGKENIISNKKKPIMCDELRHTYGVLDIEDVAMITRKLKKKLLKRDALIKKMYEEIQNLSDRLMLGPDYSEEILKEMRNIDNSEMVIESLKKNILQKDEFIMRLDRENRIYKAMIKLDRNLK